MPTHTKRDGPQTVDATAPPALPALPAVLPTPPAVNSAAMPPRKPTASPATRQTFNVNKHIFLELMQLQCTHLTIQQLEHFRINCSTLDLSSGKSSDNGPAFIRPLPIPRIRQVLELTRPWARRELSTKEGTTYPLAAALEISSYLGGYLLDSEDRESALIDSTSWKERGMDWDGNEWLSHRKGLNGPNPIEWYVEHVIEKMDGITPHLACVLVDRAPMIDKQLSHAEVWCILNCTSARLLRPEYRNQKIVPVTVISAAGRKVRVVQGYVDGQESRVQVRKSKKLNFEQEDRQNTELILSWLIGDPIGNTKA
ncbi:hypothetical protein F4778DRAFT_580960 [Xylariomycetidae sp. FL2044]|nr:hypothetical protein F4778DRAFT_580960 [Xylariomycetidae sp. FL2044]